MTTTTLHRELTFHPETERTRDLAYSEYANCNGSIHVLLQDHSVPQYRFLLDAYREIVKQYLSVSEILQPTAFLRGLADRLETLSHGAHFTVEDFKSMGFHLLLRTAGGLYLLTSNPGAVFVHRGDGLVPITDDRIKDKRRIRLQRGDLQEELFPQRLKDCFLALELEPARFVDSDIVLGCGEEDKDTVLETLQDPVWLRTASKRAAIISKFISRKIITVRFEPHTLVIEGSDLSGSLLGARSGGRRRRMIALGAVAAIVFLAAIWGSDRLMTRWGETFSPQEEPTHAGNPSPDDVGATRAIANEAPSPRPAVAAVADEAEDVTVSFEKNWTRAFSNAVTSSPVLFDRWVIFGCRDGKVHALDRDTGNPLWSAEAGNGVGASPVVAGKTVIIGDYAGTVTALDARSGEVQWRRSLPQRIVSSAAIVGEHIAVGCYDGYVYCLSVSDGTITWAHKTAGRVRGSIAAAGSVFFVASYDGHLYALRSDDGSALWKRDLGGNITASPVVYHNTVVIGTPDGTVHALNAATGESRWAYRTGGPVNGASAVWSGRVFVGSNDQHVYCLNVADGALMWKFRTGGVVLARPRIHKGTLYVGSYDKSIYCLNAESGDLLDRFETSGEIFSSPAVDEDAVYFGNNTGIFISLKHRMRKAS